MYNEWLDLVVKLQDNLDNLDVLKCPCCGYHEIDYLYIGDLIENVGYLQVWCNHCHNGINISRVKIPLNAKKASFEDMETIGKVVPDFHVVTPG